MSDDHRSSVPPQAAHVRHASDAPPRVVVQDDNTAIRLLVFTSSGAWLAETELTVRRARQVALELLTAADKHEAAERNHRAGVQRGDP